MRRVWLIVGASFGVIALAIAALLVWATINLDSIIAARRDAIIAKASGALGRKVNVASIHASLGWGVSLDLSGVMVADDPAFSSTPILTVDNIHCRVEFLPLLSRDLRISSLAIAHPALRIIRDSAGKLNISTIGKPAASAPSQPAAPLPARSATTPKTGAAASDSDVLSTDNPMETAPSRADSRDTGVLSSLYIRDLAVTDGTVSYSDSASSENPIVLKDFDFSIDDFQIDAPFRIDLALAAFGDSQNLKISGTAGPILNGARINILAVPIALELDAGPLALADLRTVTTLEKSIPPKLSIGGDLSAHGRAAGTSGALDIDIASDLGPNRVGYAPLFDKPAGVPLSIAAAASDNAGSFVLDHAAVTLASLIVNITGIRVGGGKVRARLDSNRFDLAPVAALVSPIRHYKPSGAAELHADVAANSGARPNIHGTVALTEVGLSPGRNLPPLTGLSGNVAINGNSADAGPLQFVIGGGHARLKAHADSIQPIDASYSLDADTIKPSLIVPSRPADEEIRNLRMSGTVRGTPAAPDAAATVTSTVGLISGIAYTNLSLAARIANQDLTVQSLRVGAFGGTIAAAGRVDLAGAPKFDVNADLNNIDVRQALASQRSKAADIVRGLVTGKVNVSGAGTNFDRMKPTFRGNGAIAMRNGKLVGVNVVRSALKKVNGVPGIGAFIPMNVVARHPELFKNPDTDIDRADLSFVLAGPRITTDDLIVTSADYGITGHGWFDLDKNIDMAAHILLTPRFSGEIRDAKKNAVYLENQGGQIDIPLRITGELPKPTIAPDVGDIARRAAGQAIKRKGRKFLDKLGGFLGGGSGGNKNDGSGGGGGSSNPLKNLF